MKILFVLLGIGVGTATLATRAEARDYPWCATYDMGDAAVNCGFDTMEQCMATVRGIGGSCDRNVQYQTPAPAPKYRARHKIHTGY
jgi:hypothetical protein